VVPVGLQGKPRRSIDRQINPVSDRVADKEGYSGEGTMPYCKPGISGGRRLEGRGQLNPPKAQGTLYEEESAPL